MRSLLLSTLTGILIFTWAKWHFAQYELAILEAEGEARYSRESEQKLLSGGRWVRDYNPTTGQTSYRFARKKEQR